MKEQIPTLMAKFLAEESKLGKVSGGRGRPTTPESRARRRVAKELGMSEGAVRAALRRASPPPAIHTFGLEVEQGFLDDLVALRKHISGAVAALETAGKCLEKASAVEGCAPLAVANGHVRRCLEALEGALPAGLCPFCKGIDGYCEHCTHCMGTGWTHQATLDDPDMPERLKAEGEDVLVLGLGSELVSPFEEEG